MNDVQCYEGWAQADGNAAGRCCCNCRYQKKIVGHPWNNRELTKGPISSIIGWGCNAPEMERIIMFDTKHGMCEMHTRESDPTNNVFKLVKNEKQQTIQDTK
jgi:hypothetical protein